MLHYSRKDHCFYYSGLGDIKRNGHYKATNKQHKKISYTKIYLLSYCFCFSCAKMSTKVS